MDVPGSLYEMLAYSQACDAMIDSGVDRLRIDVPDCGFPRYHMPELDQQIMNIRHIQGHVG